MFIEISLPSFFTAFVCPGFQSEILVGGGNVFGSVYLVCSFCQPVYLKKLLVECEGGYRWIARGLKTG